MKLNGIRSFVASFLGPAGSGRSRAGSRRGRLGRNGEHCEERVLLTVDFSLLYDNVTAPGIPSTSAYQFRGTSDGQGRFYFTAQDGVHGIELWTSDGTVAGTHLLKDLNPGLDNSTPYFSFGSHGNYTYFLATDNASNEQMWRTDGTEAGTIKLSFDPIVTYSDPFTFVGDTMYFTGYDNDTEVAQFWKTDGTAAGTKRIADLGLSYKNLTGIADVGGVCYYAIKTDNGHVQLWKTEPASDQVELIKDLVSNSGFRSLTAAGGKVYFEWDDGVHGRELWTSDGTDAGTKMVVDLNPSGSGFTSDLVSVGNSVAFLGTNGGSANQLWISDGTSAGTTLVKSFPAAVGVLQAVNGRLYFSTNDGVHGSEPWTSDGTTAGTFLLGDLTPGTGGSSVSQYVTLGNTVYFASAGDLWKTDGTVSGTVLVKDLTNNGSSGFSAGSLTLNGPRISFDANDGIHGAERWTSDGSEAGTVGVNELLPEIGSRASQLRLAGEGGGRIYSWEPISTGGFNFWIADLVTGQAVNAGKIDVRDAGNGSTYALLGNLFLYPGANRELWKSDGTPGGTVLVKTLGGSPSFLTSFNGFLYFFVNDSVNGTELWKTDGTANGTTAVKTLNPSVTSGLTTVRYGCGVVNGKLMFFVDDGVHGLEPWVTDGTSAGTTLLKDIFAGSSGSNYFLSALSPLFAIGDGVAYFEADDGTHGMELWKSDGTEAGTTLVQDITPGSGGTTFNSLYAFWYASNEWWNGALYFSVSDAAHGAELWKLDGATGVAGALAEIRPGTSGSGPNSYTVVNGKLLFEARDDVHGISLWTIDSSTGQPAMVYGFGDGVGTEGIRTLLYASNGKAYFTVRGPDISKELWVSDGTVAGTKRVKYLIPYPDSPTSTSFVDVSGTMYFWDRKPNSYFTYELWKTDGTEAGTVRVSDLVSKPMPDVVNASQPILGFSFNGIGVWLIDDSIHGTEWWSLRSIPESVGVYRNGTFYLDGDGSNGWKVTGNAVTDKSFAFGIAGDKPVSGDWNGDGAKDIGVFRNGVWFFDQNGNYKWNGIAGGDVTFNFGTAGDMPLVGDWNGDGVTDVGVYRNGAFYLDLNGNHKWDSAVDAFFKFGNPGDQPVTGDWNGDGKTDVGVMRGATWYLDQDGSRKWSAGDASFNFGTAGDTPVTGDWNADGKTDVGVYRSGVYYVDKNGNRKWDASDVRFGFGTSGDAPVTGTWNLGAPSVVPPPAPAALVVQASEGAVVSVEPAVAGKVKKSALKKGHKGKS